MGACGPARTRSGPTTSPTLVALDTPFCSLAIRRMTVSDAPFMVDDDRFAAAYLSRFAAEGPRRLECVRAQMAAIRQRVASVGDAVLGGAVPSGA